MDGRMTWTCALLLYNVFDTLHHLSKAAAKKRLVFAHGSILRQRCNLNNAALQVMPGDPR